MHAEMTPQKKQPKIDDRGPMGWQYPAGAANDPRAPWNEPREEWICGKCRYGYPTEEEADACCRDGEEGEE